MKAKGAGTHSERRKYSKFDPHELGTFVRQEDASDVPTGAERGRTQWKKANESIRRGHESELRRRVQGQIWSSFVRKWRQFDRNKMFHLAMKQGSDVDDGADGDQFGGCALKASYETKKRTKIRSNEKVENEMNINSYVELWSCEENETKQRTCFTCLENEMVERRDARKKEAKWPRKWRSRRIVYRMISKGRFCLLVQVDSSEMMNEPRISNECQDTPGFRANHKWLTSGRIVCVFVVKRTTWSEREKGLVRQQRKHV